MTDVRPVPARLLDPAAAFASFAAVLWNEREALERVLFKIFEERLVLEAPAYRWLGKADDELRSAIRTLDGCEDERSAAVGELAAALGLDPSCTLAQLIDAAPVPWPLVLDDHRIALRVLVRDVHVNVAATRELLATSARSMRDILDDLDDLGDLDTDGGARRDVMAVSDELRNVDRVLMVAAVQANHESALATTAGLKLQLQLSAFLD